MNNILSYEEFVNEGYRSIEKIKDKNSVPILFRKLGFKIPDGYLNFILKYNGSSPDKKCFDIDGEEGNFIEYFLSFNDDSKINIYKYINGNIEGMNEKLLPFGIDAFGNCICFDYRSNKNPDIVFWDHETDNISYITNSFTKFIAMLY